MKCAGEVHACQLPYGVGWLARKIGINREREGMKRYLVITGLLVGSFFVAANGVFAAEAAEGMPTFAKDVAPILYENCVVCHRDGEVAPMQLISFQEVRPWSRAIKEKVVNREMPPWLADSRYGRFANDRSLAQEDIDTIVAWVDGGAPRGNDADLPVVPELPKGWAWDDPDVIVEMPIEFQLPAEGEVQMQHIYNHSPFEEDVYIQAVQLLPGNTRVVHHAAGFVKKLPEGSTLEDGLPFYADGTPVPRREIGSLDAESPASEGASKLVSYVPGRGWERYPAGTAKRLPEGWVIDFGMHYQVSGKPETDRTRLGFWFPKERVTHEILNPGAGGRSTTIAEGKELLKGGAEYGGIPTIPAHADDWRIAGVMPFNQDATLYGFSPHMHLRGKSMSYSLTYPDGREEMLLSVPKYDFNWQLYYELAEPVKIPAGSKISAVATYDNSIRNRYNPAPDKEVYWAEQSWDEMFSPQMRYSYDNKILPEKNRPSTED